MDTLFSLKVFCQVVESGSFTKASDILDISTAMTSKHVTHLEKSVNARLLHRTSRSLSLTNEGEVYYAQCLQALGLLNRAEQQISAGKITPQGHLRIAAPIWCASLTFANWITEYQALYPEVTIDLVLDNAMTDLASDTYDLALRVNESIAPSLIARPLMRVPFVLVASPDYIETHGAPSKPKQLEQHEFVLPSYVDIREFTFHTRIQDHKAEINYSPEVLNLKTKTQSNNTIMLKELVIAGSGIGYLPIWLVEEAITSGKLIQLFDKEFYDEVTLHAVYLSRRHLSAKIRSFIDFMVGKADK